MSIHHKKTSKKTSKKTKIIATLGPACMDINVLKKMIAVGTDMVRINASHNEDPSVIVSLVEKVRMASVLVDRNVGVFLDLQGPKIRLGNFENNEVELKNNQFFTLTSREIVGTSQESYISYHNFYQDVKKNDTVYIDDGKIILVVDKVKNKDVICRVVRSGKISNHKGVNLPMTEMSINPFTEKDKEDALMGIKASVDYIALSFVSSKKNITDFRTFLNKNNGDGIQIIAKIERQKAVDNLVEVIDAADAVMVARGDLGVEVGIEKVPQIQKKIIYESNKQIKPVIVATQMLESMISSEIATRAEVSDVANAVYDNCDAVMLSGETAIGINPVQVIELMCSICETADHHLDELQDTYSIKSSVLTHSVATSFCKAASQVAYENSANAIIAFTSSGNTPLISSKTKTRYPIIAPTDEASLCCRMSLYKGVIPLLLPKKFKDITRWRDMINLAVTQCEKFGYLSKGDVAVITAGIPIGQSNGINSIRIITV
jgi:pyruvate kinase